MKEIDLILSGSGVRLGCHYGAILALKKRNYKVIRIAGTSGGAIVAAAYACYYPFEDIWHILKSINFKKLMCDGKFEYLRLAYKNGLYKGDEFEKFIDKNITRGTRLEEFPGLYIIATDITNKEPLILNALNGFSKMKVSEAIRMSMSAPLYWVPKYLTLNGDKLTIVDGGISANYYIDLFDDNERQSIGILLYTKNIKSKLKIFNYFRNILDTMMIANENEHIEDANWARTIKINTGDIRPFDLDINSEQVEQLIKKGYQDTLDTLDKKIEKEIS